VIVEVAVTTHVAKEQGLMARTLLCFVKQPQLQALQHKLSLHDLYAMHEMTGLVVVAFAYVLGYSCFAFLL